MKYASFLPLPLSLSLSLFRASRLSSALAASRRTSTSFAGKRPAYEGKRHLFNVFPSLSFHLNGSFHVFALRSASWQAGRPTCARTIRARTRASASESSRTRTTRSAASACPVSNPQIRLFVCANKSCPSLCLPPSLKRTRLSFG